MSMQGAVKQVVPSSICVPNDLAELDQWVLWRYETRDGNKPAKIPYKINGSRASTTDPATWSSFEAVVEYWRRYPKSCDGLGFVFAADPFAGIDLDDCVADG